MIELKVPILFPLHANNAACVYMQKQNIPVHSTISLMIDQIKSSGKMVLPS